MKHSRFPFFWGAWSGAAPLLLWALHFAFCYAGVAIGCMAIEHGALAPQQLRVLLAVGTLAALGAGAWMLLRACRAAREGRGDLLPRVRLGASLMAWIGMLWTAVPLWILPICQLA